MEQKIEITLEELLELKDKILNLTEAYQKLLGEYKYLYHIYKEQLKILEQYEEILYGGEEKEEEIKKNPIGFNR